MAEISTILTMVSSALVTFVLALISGSSWLPDDFLWACLATAADNHLFSKTRLLLFHDFIVPGNKSLFEQQPVFVFTPSFELLNVPEYVQDNWDVVLVTPEIGDRVLGERGTKGRIMVLTNHENLNLWRDYRSVDVVFLLTNGSGFLTWFPYSNCSKTNNVHWTFLDLCSQDGSYCNTTNLFPNKIPERLTNCSLYVTPAVCNPYTFEDDQGVISGPESFIFRTAVEKLDLSLEYLKLPLLDFFLTYKVDGSLNGAIELLSLRKADLAFGCLLRSLDRTQHASFLPSYFEDYLVFSVPSPRPKPLTSGLYSGFNSFTWDLILISVCLKLILVVIFNFVLKTKDRLPKVLDIVRVSLGMPAMFRPRTWITMAIFAIFQICSTQIVWFYQSTLLFNLFLQPYEKAITTLQEAADSDLFLQFRPSHFPHLNNSSPQILGKIFQPDQYKMTYFINLTLVTEEKSSIALGVKSHDIYSYQQLYPQNTNSISSKLLFLPEPLALLHFVMYMPLNHPLHSRISRYFAYMIESGFFDHWFQDQDIEANIIQKIANPLDLLHLQSAFYLLITFLFITLLMFFAEMFYAQLKDTPNNTVSVKRRWYYLKTNHRF